jgi:hypothetical protein
MRYQTLWIFALVLEVICYVVGVILMHFDAPIPLQYMMMFTQVPGNVLAGHILSESASMAAFDAVMLVTQSVIFATVLSAAKFFNDWLRKIDKD